MKNLFCDVSSFSNLAYFKTNHIDWFIDVDFSTETLKARALEKLECILPPENNILFLDTRDLTIENVKVNENDVEFKLTKKSDALGQALEIHLPSSVCTLGAKFDVSLLYQTSPKASAAQWLPPEQTLGKKLPYMFTQCEAIHARSLIPCQDSPGIKFTYYAEVTVPGDMIALMSAIKGDESVLENGARKMCSFKQDIQIPAYLIAIAVGAIYSRRVGPRSKVWCEAEMIDACEYEFGNVEEVLQAAETFMGEYVWGVYDMLVLPPSFPFGGMENPCLTFLTPTIITGDRSLTSVMIHEITHSWTGNLVTNRKWEDFWLNEGFTRFIEMKINGVIDGELCRQFMHISGWHSLIDCVNDFGPSNKLTALVPELNGIDPDDAFSAVPYEKGSSFLFYIESLLGGADVFNPFLKDYISHFKSKAVETQDFKDFLFNYFSDKKDILEQIDWNGWLYSPGMPPVNVIDLYDTTYANSCKALCEKWVEATDATTSNLDSFDEKEFTSFTTRQKISFLSKLYHEKPLALPVIEKMAETYKLLENKVSEIRFAFLRLCIKSRWSEAYPHVTKFLLDQGRMKFTRPLYKEMFKYDESKHLAVQTFQKNKNIYHIIASNMIGKDLKLVE